MAAIIPMLAGWFGTAGAAGAAAAGGGALGAGALSGVGALGAAGGAATTAGIMGGTGMAGVGALGAGAGAATMGGLMSGTGAGGGLNSLLQAAPLMGMMGGGGRGQQPQKTTINSTTPMSSLSQAPQGGQQMGGLASMLGDIYPKRPKGIPGRMGGGW